MDAIQAYCNKFKVPRSKAEQVAREQARHPEDIAQPGSQLFENAWGKNIRRNEEIRRKQEQEAQNEKKDREERKEFEKHHDPLHPKYI